MGTPERLPRTVFAFVTRLWIGAVYYMSAVPIERVSQLTRVSQPLSVTSAHYLGLIRSQEALLYYTYSHRYWQSKEQRLLIRVFEPLHVVILLHSECRYVNLEYSNTRGEKWRDNGHPNIPDVQCCYVARAMCGSEE